MDATANPETGEIGRQLTTIEAGRHEVEKIPSPHGHNCDWLVLKGTKIGASVGSWRQWSNYTDDYKVTIEE
jgi:hypothetical protein